MNKADFLLLCKKYPELATMPEEQVLPFLAARVCERLRALSRSTQQ